VSDPGEPSTFEEAFVGKDSKFWGPVIYKEIINFAKRKVWKEVNKNVMINGYSRRRWIKKEM
jgi:hypothetical protein